MTTTAEPGREPRWVREQRAHLRAVVVGRFGVHPPWLEPVGEIALSIDPGATFGHGAHPTTALCLEALDALDVADTTVLDVGCGSGVLAIAAAAIGGEVSALDIDPEAVATTRTNAEANDARVSIIEQPLAEVDARFGVVLANMLPSALLDLRRDLERVTECTLVLSGIPIERRDEVAGPFDDLPSLARRDDRVRDGWVSLRYDRTG